MHRFTRFHPLRSRQICQQIAFHWLRLHQHFIGLISILFYKESKRILKHNGIVCIVANARIYDSFTEKQHQICKQYCPSYVSLTHGVDKVLRKADAFFKGISFWKDFIIHCIIQSRNSLPVVYRLHMPPKKDTDYYKGYIHSLQALLDDTFPDDGIVIENETVMLWGKLS